METDHDVAACKESLSISRARSLCVAALQTCLQAALAWMHDMPVLGRTAVRFLAAPHHVYACAQQLRAFHAAAHVYDSSHLCSHGLQPPGLCNLAATASRMLLRRSWCSIWSLGSLLAARPCQHPGRPSRACWAAMATLLWALGLPRGVWTSCTAPIRCTRSFWCSCGHGCLLAFESTCEAC